MFMHPEDRNKLEPPYADYELFPATLEAPPEPTVETILDRMRCDVRKTHESAGADAARAVVVAIGNYEYLSFRRPEIMDEALLLLQEVDPGAGQTHRWGP